MTPPKKNNGNGAGAAGAGGAGYVSRIECAAVMGPTNQVLVTIQKALIGEDMRSGLVKDVSDLKTKVDSILENAQCNAQDARDAVTAKKLAWTKEKVAIIGLAGSVAGIIVGQVLSKFL